MHAQIHHVINRLQFSPGQVFVELSAGEQSPLGKILNIVYYRTNICDTLDRDNRFGYPHNGGQHTFSYRGTHGDAVAMIELIKETVMDNFKLDDEVRQVASELSFVSQEILSGRRKCP